MALIACVECSNQISSDAKVCPKCGKRVQRSWGLGKLAFVLTVGGIIAAMIAASLTQSVDREVSKAVAAKQAAMTPEQKAAEQKRVLAEATAKRKKELAFQLVVSAMRVIREANRNPASVTWESVVANDDASVICIQYRGQNGFGGMNKEFVVITGQTASQKASAWNKHCAGKSLTDMLYARQAL